MNVKTAISLLGTREPPRHLVDFDDFAMFGDVNDKWPCFVMNRQSTIQFRLVKGTIDAIFLHPDEVESFDTLRHQIADLGFSFEKKHVIHMDSGKAYYDCFTKEKVRVQIPQKLTGQAGFEDAVTIETVR